MKYLLLMLSIIAFAEARATDLRVQLQWKHQFQFAGFYVAKERGFYADAGLDVTLVELPHGIHVTDEVVKGKAHIGIGRSSLLIERNHGTPIVILDAIFDYAPSVLITTQPDLITPESLRGKKIMISTDESGSAGFKAILQSQQLTMDDVTLIPHSFNLDDLIERRVDAYAGYLSNEPFILQERNISFNIMNPRDYGFSFYGDLLFTSESMLQSHPKEIEAFVKATRLGWQEAFAHIDKTAQLIHTKFNTQNKSLQSLIYEGMVLKGLLCSTKADHPILDLRRFEEIMNLYRLGGLIQQSVALESYIDPMHFTRSKVRIAFLAKRGRPHSIKRWQPMMDYLNYHLPSYHFEALPLTFEEIEEAARSGSVDFIFTNTAQYVKLEHYYGLSRIATLKNASPAGPLDTFGAVILTRSDNIAIGTLDDLRGKRFGAVNADSFGGYLMGLKTLMDAGIGTKDLDSLTFFGTHDQTIEAILNGLVDAATVRTDTLERMARDQNLDLSQLKILAAKHYQGFPFLVSTPLYPEWPIAKLPHTPTDTADALLGILLQMQEVEALTLRCDIGGWGIPLNYKPVNDLLRSLQLEPYLPVQISLLDVIKTYAHWIIGSLAVLLGAFAALFKIGHLNTLLKKHNHTIERFNEGLEAQVRNRTIELEMANKKLQTIAQTDALTGINNRRNFFDLAERYFYIAKRNQTALSMLALDIDYFKTINDRYGHAAGDEVLKNFCATISEHLRKSDLFGRIGGEEFNVTLHITAHPATNRAEHPATWREIFSVFGF